MAFWLLDEERSAKTGRYIFNKPYPGDSWYEDKENNEGLLNSMDLAMRVMRVGVKLRLNHDLSKEEDRLLDFIVEYIDDEWLLTTNFRQT